MAVETETSPRHIPRCTVDCIGNRRRKSIAKRSSAVSNCTRAQFVSFESILGRLDKPQQNVLQAVKKRSEDLLNHTSRFKFFTLHGTHHLNNLFEILELLISGGIKLNNEEIFLLSLAICIHDLGMVVPLKDKEIPQILDGRSVATDPAALELYIRDTHHELVDAYFQHDFGFLTALGLSAAQLAQVFDISRCHRKVVLQSQTGVIKHLGALLRIIDELDLGANRAPSGVFLNVVDDMDATSTWHWFKHNIVEGWLVNHTVSFISENDRRKVMFRLIVHPTNEQSVDYWLHQIRRPIKKALVDDGAAAIVLERYGVEIDVVPLRSQSKPQRLTAQWAEIESKALSAGRKVILVIDDEFRKLEDLFYPLMDHFHVMASPNAKDALEKLAATNTALAIVDMQIGSGGLWKDHETQSFKATGLRICQEIQDRYPSTKIGVLTGTKHPLNPSDIEGISFFARKPIDPDKLLETVRNVLS